MFDMGKMKRSTIIWIVVGAVVLIFLLWFMGSYNRFVTLDQDINGKWSEVENQYQVQAEKIPNLVSSVSSQVGVETKFVKDVIDARTKWQSSAGTSQLARDTAGQQMNSGINAFVNSVAENYPTLQASEGYTALRDEMVGMQNRIGTARGRYITSIQAYNTAIKRFPGNIIAGMFGFSGKDYYKAEAGSLTTPSLGTGTLP